MVSTVFNVTRWTVFGVGIAYGFYHQQGIYSSASAAAKQAKYDNKVKLIEQAKAEWAKQHPKPKGASAPAANLDDPNFDPAKWVDSEVANLSS